MANVFICDYWGRESKLLAYLGQGLKRLESTGLQRPERMVCNKLFYVSALSVKGDRMKNIHCFQKLQRYGKAY
jgi:hypothetical protein